MPSWRQRDLALLRELVPGAGILALLVNPNDPDAGTQLADVHVAARDLGRQLVVLKAGTAGEIDAAFASLVQQRAAALVVTTDPFYLNRRDQIVALAARYAIPAIYSNRDFTAAGGFMSYGNNMVDVYRRNRHLRRPHSQRREASGPSGRCSRPSSSWSSTLRPRKLSGTIVPLSLPLRADEVIE